MMGLSCTPSQEGPGDVDLTIRNTCYLYGSEFLYFLICPSLSPHPYLPVFLFVCFCLNLYCMSELSWGPDRFAPGMHAKRVLGPQCRYILQGYTTAIPIPPPIRNWQGAFDGHFAAFCCLLTSFISSFFLCFVSYPFSSFLFFIVYLFVLSSWQTLCWF